MRTIHFDIVNIEALDSYLYAGNLYVVFADGHIGYISFDRIIHILREAYHKYDNIIQLAFLHNDYTQTPSGTLLLGIQRVKEAVEQEWREAQNEISLSIDYREISRYFHFYGEYHEMPLDIRIYAMRLYLGCKDGLYESRFSQDDNTIVNQTNLERVFDSKVVSVNAKYGAIAISADKEGLFSSELSDEDSPIRVSDKPVLDGRSLRTDWKDVDLLNYDSASEFSYLHNEYERTEKQQPFYYQLRKGNEHKRITEIGIQIEDMMPILDNLQIQKDEVDYCFNSGSVAFFRLTNGEFFATDFQSRQGGAYRKEIKEVGRRKKILSSAVIPNGCVLNYFDKTVMYRDGKSFVLSDEPAYGIRSYMNAKRYRSILTVNNEHSLCVFSAETFTPLEPRSEKYEDLGKVRYSNVFRGKSELKKNDNDFDIPF